MRLVLLLLCMCTQAKAQVFMDPETSFVRASWRHLYLEIVLSERTPFRVFTLDNPPRLVLDLQDVVWPQVAPESLMTGSKVLGLRLGRADQTWSRMIIEMDGPMEVVNAVMATSAQDAVVGINMWRTDAQTFAEVSGAPDGVTEFAPIVLPDDMETDFQVIIDPGHGGIDPGALREGLNEADLMLQLGQEVAQALNAIDGVQAILTRDTDVFVPLAARVSLARSAGADLFISLHADALEEDAASGASVYTLSHDGGSLASWQMITRHERGDLLGGVDLTAQGDLVAALLMDLARDRTGPLGVKFADILVAQMKAAGVHVNSNPRRFGQLAVLSAADFPSVLVEVGFLSNAQDRAAITDRAGRAEIATAIVAAVNEFKRDIVIR